jgi:hypothetical protein
MYNTRRNFRVTIILSLRSDWRKDLSGLYLRWMNFHRRINTLKELVLPETIKIFKNIKIRVFRIINIDGISH